MNRKFMLSIAACILGLLFCSCGSDDDMPSIPAAISVESKLVEVSRLQNDIVVNVNSTLDAWSCTTDADWCYLQQNQKGIRILVDANRSGKERSAIIKLKCGEGNNVAENQFELKQLVTLDVNTLMLTQDSVYFDSKGGTLKVGVVSDVELTGVDVPSEYAQYIRAIATGGVVTIVAAKNMTKTPVVAELVVRSANKSAKLKVYLDLLKRELFEVYDFNGTKAIVYKVNQDGSGMAVSVDEFNMDNTWNMNVKGWRDINGKKLTGCTASWNYGGNNQVTGLSLTDGWVNMSQWRVVHKELMDKNLPENHDATHNPFAPAMYDSPAFLWCEYKNTDGAEGWYLNDPKYSSWYLPSVTELQEIAELYQGNVERMNDAFLQNKGNTMGNELWSSSMERGMAYYVDMIEAKQMLSSRLNDTKGIRAVIAFKN